MKYILQILIYLCLLHGVFGHATTIEKSNNSIGFQSLTCGGKKFQAQSLDFYGLYELANMNHSKFSNFVTPGVGSIDEWSCIKIQGLFYLFIRGEFAVRGTQDIQHTALYVLQIDADRLMTKGDIHEYIKLIQSDEPEIAKNKFPKIDLAYRSATFRKFKFQ